MTTRKLLLAYSGGLDTSCILAWLIDEGYEVYAYMANIGQDEDFEAARRKALAIGARGVFVEDLRQEFLRETIVPAVQANCLYEGVYLLGTALARPVIAQRQIELARREGCQFVAHGCTGKGNDQVRFELAYYALHPDMKVVAPWRMRKFYERFQGRSDLLAYAEQRGVPVQQTVAKPWSTDENMFHVSYEAGVLEDPNVQPPPEMWRLTKGLKEASVNGEDCVTLTFERGVPVRLQHGQRVLTDLLALFNHLNALGREHGIGRVDIVENRFIGLKSRGCYETPGGTILLVAHRDLEGLVMDREVRRVRDDLSKRFAELIYNGLWFSPERELVQHAITHSQHFVNGQVTLSLYKGNVTVVGRDSRVSLYDRHASSMDVGGGLDPEDSTGFIRTQAIRLRAYQTMKEQQQGQQKKQ